MSAGQALLPLLFISYNNDEVHDDYDDADDKKKLWIKIKIILYEKYDSECINFFDDNEDDENQ